MVTRTPSRTAAAPLFHADLHEITLDQALRALGDPVRLRIVRTLATAPEPMPCSAFDLGVAKSTSTHHFRVLRENGIIRQWDQGTARLSQLRRADLVQRFPGLLEAVLASR
jgi:DNA-binding transcriptional ArsR family regulator